jgi:hypothetical protein
MESNKVIDLLQGILSAITNSNGDAAIDQFNSLRQVDAKVREAKMILSSVNGLPESLVADMEKDEDFQANSRRVRLETLANYVNSALGFLEAGGITTTEKPVLEPPDTSKLTAIMPNLQYIIEERWIEAQRCQNVEAYTASVILMGSILEALLLCRAMSSPPEAYRSPKAPKGKNGKIPAIQDWKLNTLIEVAVERE